MSPKRRLVLQAVLYEIFAIILVGPVLSIVFGKSMNSSLGLAAVLSTIALTWNFVFNMIFESWEHYQASKERTFRRRLLHGVGFEGGLVVLLVPVMAWWLETSLLTAFITNIGLMAFFFFYAILFTWIFDRVFGLPASASNRM
ncbi:MAG: PACE efflux transporter [Nitrosomonas sp.]